MRPLKTFNHFIGQRRIVQFLARLTLGAKAQGKPCPPLLFIAPAGYGKTSLAQAVADEYGTDLHSIFAGNDTSAHGICQTLFQLRDGDFLFIDEAHSLGEDAQQVLYVALDQKKAPRPGERRLNRTTLGSVASFGLILATNEPGRLKKGLRTRLTRIEWDPYTERELRAIAEHVAVKEGFEITPQAARRLAEAAQGMPRSICRRLEMLKCLNPGLSRLILSEIEKLLASEGVDHRGLYPGQRQYLLALLESQSGTCSLERLSVKLGCDATNIRQEVEPYLFEQGLVETISGRGRTFTEKGRALAMELAASNAQDEAEREYLAEVV